MQWHARTHRGTHTYIYIYIFIIKFVWVTFFHRQGIFYNIRAITGIYIYIYNVVDSTCNDIVGMHSAWGLSVFFLSNGPSTLDASSMF